MLWWLAIKGSHVKVKSALWSTNLDLVVPFQQGVWSRNFRQFCILRAGWKASIQLVSIVSEQVSRWLTYAMCALNWLYYLWAIDGFAWLSFHNFGDSRLQGDIYFTEHISIYKFNSGKKERKWGSLLGIHYITQRTDAVVQVAHNWAEEGLIIQEPHGTSVAEGRRGDSREAVGDRAASLFKTHISVPGDMSYPFCSKIKQKYTAQGSQLLHLQADKYQS